MRRHALFVTLAVVVLIAAAIPAAAKQRSDPAPNQRETIVLTFIDPKLPLSAQVVKVTFQFNPKELSVTKAVPWGHGKHENDSEPKLEFTQGKPHSLSFELMFDGYETKTDLGPLFADLAKYVALPNEKMRPPIVRFLWGDLVEFQGVINDLNVKYTLFLDDGTPVRATCNITLREAQPAHMNDRSGNETQ
jgi:Contractile injection system tube protein